MNEADDSRKDANGIEMVSDQSHGLGAVSSKAIEVIEGILYLSSGNGGAEKSGRSGITRNLWDVRGQKLAQFSFWTWD